MQSIPAKFFENAVTKWMDGWGKKFINADGNYIIDQNMRVAYIELPIFIFMYEPYELS